MNANSSTLSRVKPSRLAMRPRRCLDEPSGSGPAAARCPHPAADAANQREVDSTPPATTRSWKPEAMPCAAKITARSTEAAESVDRRTRHLSRPTGSQDAHASNVLTVITVVGPICRRSRPRRSGRCAALGHGESARTALEDGRRATHRSLCLTPRRAASVKSAGRSACVLLNAKDHLVTVTQARMTTPARSVRQTTVTSSQAS